MHLPPLYACEYCGTQIDPNDKTIWTLITGWTQPRKPAAPKYPTAPHGWACNGCMVERKHGTPPDSLF